MKYTLNLFITNYVVNDKGLCENDSNYYYTKVVYHVYFGS